jgi:beta-galactosidase
MLRNMGSSSLKKQATEPMGLSCRHKPGKVSERATILTAVGDWQRKGSHPYEAIHRRIRICHFAGGEPIFCSDDRARSVARSASALIRWFWRGKSLKLPIKWGSFAKAPAMVIFAVLVMSPPSAAQSHSTNTILIDASKSAVAQPIPNPQLGGRPPAGHEIGVNSQYLTLDGKPWLPVMGEFHFSRYPEQYWEEELLKMKAGGVQIVATYLFWIHHEEIEGQFDWSGQRDLRRFIQLCQKHGLYVFLRIGPWSHGEVRNGGFPDWLLARTVTRRNDPQYLSYVQRYFGQVGEQVKGLLWKDGGPIVGVQFENEYYEHGPGAGAEHISKLKTIARDCGIEAPLYTVTGWGNPDFPAGEVIPVFGGYPDDFWESALTDLPPSGYYLFENKRDNGGMGGPSAAEQPAQPEYPYLMSEAGGGMQVAYHRRPVISADDVAAITLTRLGSGANLYGYYMYQGGSNPAGKLTSLQESIASDHVYDLPKISYDFQAPLGEFGEMNPAFRATKVLHLFLNQFGSSLAPMAPVLPTVVPANAADRSTVRASARTQGNRGFVFFNNYARNYPLPDHRGIQIKLVLPSETVVLPRKPIDLVSGTYGIWPVNLDLNGILLKYATAQPLTMVRDANVVYYFFLAPPGIQPEFAFDERTLTSLKAGKGVISRASGFRYVGGLVPGPGIALSARSKTGQTVHVIVLTRSEAQNLWKFTVAGGERIFLSPADVFFDDRGLHLRARDVRQLRFSVFPALKNAPVANVPLKPAGRDGVFVSYSVSMPRNPVPVRWEKVRAAAPSLPGKVGKYNAMAPDDSDFERAGVWHIVLPAHALDGLSDVFLQIQYAGDVARLEAGQRLLADDFYKGMTWEIGMKRFATESFGKNLELKIMPLRKDAPIYMPASAWPEFPLTGEIADVSGIHALPEYEVRVDMEDPH